MVVCTLCSCYPWPLLGIPPGWYKSDAYRARAVREPRAVLAEFGVTLPETARAGLGFDGRDPLSRPARCAPGGPRAWSPMRWPRWSPATAMIGTGLPRERGAS
jgi:nitrile hydratase